MYSLWDKFLEHRSNNLSVSLMFHRKLDFEKGIKIITYILMIVLFLLEEKTFRVCQFMCLSVLFFSPNPFILRSMVTMAFASITVSEELRTVWVFLSFTLTALHSLTSFLPLTSVKSSLAFPIPPVIISCCCGYLWNTGVLNRLQYLTLFSFSMNSLCQSCIYHLCASGFHSHVSSPFLSWAPNQIFTCLLWQA